MPERAALSDEDLEQWLLNAQHILQQLYAIKALAAPMLIAYPDAGDLDAAIAIMDGIVARLSQEQKRRQEKNGDETLCL